MNLKMLENGKLVRGARKKIYLWSDYNRDENCMTGDCETKDNLLGVIVEMKPTANIVEYGWIAKIITTDEQGKITFGWTWCDLLKEVNLYVFARRDSANNGRS